MAYWAIAEWGIKTITATDWQKSVFHNTDYTESGGFSEYFHTRTQTYNVNFSYGDEKNWNYNYTVNHSIVINENITSYTAEWGNPPLTELAFDREYWATSNYNRVGVYGAFAIVGYSIVESDIAPVAGIDFDDSFITSANGISNYFGRHFYEDQEFITEYTQFPTNAFSTSLHTVFSLPDDPSGPANLFTSFNDVVNFNSLTTEQQEFISSSGTASVRKALPGNDNVVLPASKALYGQFGWNGRGIFYGDAGDDTISSGPFDDLLYGNDDNDVILGKSGNDTLDGGSGDDKLVGGSGEDFIRTGTGTDSIFGGTDHDIVRLPGLPNHYTFKDQIEGLTKFSSVTSTEIKRLVDVEEVIFDSGVGDNQLTFGNAYEEMARLALDVYRGDPPSGLVKDPNWHLVHANELGMPLEGPLLSLVQWTYLDGQYATSSLVDDQIAVASVHSGQWQGKSTVTVAFRGTDDYTDRFLGWNPATFDLYFDQFRPFIEAVTEFVNKHAVERIFVTGHSLGGAVAQTFMDELPANTRFLSATFGANGTTQLRSDDRIIHFAHAEDLVPALPLLHAGAEITMPLNILSTTADDGFGTYEHSMARYVASVGNLAGLFAETPGAAPFMALGQHDPSLETRIYAGDNTHNQIGDDVDLDPLLSVSHSALYGRAGRDVLVGFAGNDTLDGGSGIDLVDYSSEEDVLGSLAVHVNLSNGTATDAFGYTDVLAQLENVIGTSRADSIRGAPTENLLLGLAGDDTLNGAAGNDTLIGGQGKDKLVGWSGNDSLVGQSNEDTLEGGAHNDTLIGGHGADTLIGASGEDSLDGGSQDDWLNSGAHNDILAGGLGSDTLVAFTGDDSLIGGENNDFLLAGDGIDSLNGGAGDDLLNGNADGNVDTFEFDRADWGKDRIRNFEDGIDTLDMTGSGIVSLAQFGISQIVDGSALLRFDADNFIRLYGMDISLIDNSDFIFDV